MIFLILWHSLIGLMFLTCFPGILLIFIRKVAYFKYLTEFYKYILVLIVVLLIDTCLFLSNTNIYLCVSVIIITPVIVYITEKSLLFNKICSTFITKQQIYFKCVTCLPNTRRIKFPILLVLFQLDISLSFYSVHYLISTNFCVLSFSISRKVFHSKIFLLQYKQ